MSSSAQTLTAEEEKLLRAAVIQGKAVAAGPDLEVRRILYGFETNLPEYGGAIVDEAPKAALETALRRLLDDGFLRRIEAGQQCWHYAVTEKGNAAIPEG